MTSEKFPINKTTIASYDTGNNNNATFCRSNSAQKSSNDIDTDDARRPNMDLHEFLDFLNVTCHVNEMISNSGLNEGGCSTINNNNTNNNSITKKKSNINFKKLADNQLINDLYGHKKNLSNNELDEIFTEQVKINIRAPTVENMTQRNRNNNNHTAAVMTATAAAAAAGNNFTNKKWQTWKKSDQSHTSMNNNGGGMGELHPKLKQKLDFVINEGVLDSVLPFICPINIPSANSNPPRGGGGGVKIKPKDIAGKKESSAVIETEIVNSATIAEADKEAAIGGAGDTSASIVKLREQKNQNRNKIQSYARSQILQQRLENPLGYVSDDWKEPDVIIHVCDEVKNASKDFSCPQNLLVSKMGYFADVTAGQKLDDMDISVHCDIQIFDWLMRWVKHGNNSSTTAASSATSVSASASDQSIDCGPQLDATNVIPILVSASFLQMEPLFDDCLSFCHARLSEIVRVSSNLSCLNDSMITCLAAMFTNIELEAIRDKKERVTPRLWTKLIQSLCEPEPEALRGHYYSLAGLFRCSKCDKCLTNTMKSYISCIPSNVRLNRWGQVVSHHVRDSTWDINTYIAQLFKEQKSWRKVYWKLWGHCHFLYCCACESHFPVYQMSWCKYHPEGPNYLGPVTEGRMAGPTGRYPCCGQQAFRFETITGPNGCQFREHSVLVETDRERAILNIAQLVSEGNGLWEPPPFKLQEAAASNANDTEPRWAGISLMPQRCRQGLLPVLNPDDSVSRIVRRVRGGGASSYFVGSSSGSSDTSDTLEDVPKKTKRRFMQNTICQSSFSTSSDGCESDYSDIKTTNSKKGDHRKRQTETPGRNWSGELSARSNQDNQREFEEKVMKQVVAIVNKKLGSEHMTSQSSVPIGGTYIRLETEWREQLKQRNNNVSNNNSIMGQHNSTFSTSTTTASSGVMGNKQKK